MKLLSFFVITLSLFLLSCGPSTQEKQSRINDSINNHHEADSLIKRLTFLDNLAKTNNKDSVSLMFTEILHINQRLIKILSSSEFVKVTNARNKSNLNKEFVVKGYYRIGMEDKEVRRNLGNPDKVNRTVYSDVVKEQWVYDNRNLYLYFENGVLVTIQEEGK